MEKFAANIGRNCGGEQLRDFTYSRDQNVEKLSISGFLGSRILLRRCGVSE
jgi:hypothetical protein